MTDRTIDLHRHRGMAAQKATDLRRLRSAVEADQLALRMRQAELEDLLAAAPAANWPEAVEKVRYLLGLFAQSPAAADPRRRKLIERVMADFDRLLGDDVTATGTPGADQQGRRAMAKGEQRGNREAKKPKKEKPKQAAPVSPFATQSKTPAKPPSGKR